MLGKGSCLAAEDNVHGIVPAVFYGLKQGRGPEQVLYIGVLFLIRQMQEGLEMCSTR